MKNLLSSQERLKDESLINCFVHLFAKHGALGYSKLVNPSYADSEITRLEIVPLVFGLIPEAALNRKRPDELIKPHIEKHLNNLGIDKKNLLIDILKSIADQYYFTRPGSSKRKKGITDLQVHRSIYKQILVKQSSRCTICGISFSENIELTLDHIIPWRLVGDIPDGANWQILCRDCNLGKREYLSSLQSTQAFNWIYGGQYEQIIISNNPTPETRFIVLAQMGQCEYPKCNIVPSLGELFVVKKFNSGLPVVDNLQVRCKLHLT